MAKLVINSYEEFASHLGQKLGESEWLQVDQDRINKFVQDRPHPFLRKRGTTGLVEHPRDVQTRLISLVIQGLQTGESPYFRASAKD